MKFTIGMELLGGIYKSKRKAINYLEKELKLKKQGKNEVWTTPKGKLTEKKIFYFISERKLI